MVMVVAGNDALTTVKAQKADLSGNEYVIFRDGEDPINGFVHHAPSTAQAAGSHP